MKKNVWILAALLGILSSCNGIPAVVEPVAEIAPNQPTLNQPTLNQPTLSAMAPDCDRIPAPPICTDPPPPPPPPPPPVPTNRAYIQLNQLTVTDAQEEGSWYDNGDEPYFVTLGFRSRVFTPNSTKVFWNNTLASGTFSGLDDGAVRNLPTSMQGVSFSNLNRVGSTDIRSGRFPEIIGAITISIEDDLTSDSTMKGLINDLKNELQAQLQRTVERGAIDLNDPASSIKAAIDHFKSLIEPSFLGKVKIFLGSFGNPDDVIGFHAYMYAVTDNTVSFPATHDALLSAGVLPYGTLPLSVRFRGDGAVYDVSSAVRYVPAP